MDNETNKRLHLALGRHWHEADEPDVNCSCGLDWRYINSQNPDYRSDLNLCAEAEKEVIERKVGSAAYGKALAEQVWPATTVPALNEFFYDIGNIATASSKQRVAAMI